MVTAIIVFVLEVLWHLPTGRSGQWSELFHGKTTSTSHIILLFGSRPSDVSAVMPLICPDGLFCRTRKGNFVIASQRVARMRAR
jgi:hypothetical protein